MDKIIRYPEGLRAVVESNPSAHSVSIGIWTNAGSRKEDSANNGISHFIEHMIFKGTDKLDAFQIAKSFEDMGAAINAFTSKDCTCYYVKAVEDCAEPCFKLLSHIFLNSDFKASELDRERNVIIEEINMQEDAPEDICYNLLADCLYDGPLSLSVLGPAENIRRFGKKDIAKYMQTHYCLQNIVIAFAGAITPEQADALVRKYFLPYVTIKGDCVPPAKNTYASKQTIKIEDYEQANMYLAFPSVGVSHPESAVQTLLSVIMGGGMSSRLFQKVREQLGLAYSIYTSPSAYVGAGSFNICVNYTASNTSKILKCLKDEMTLLLDKGITSEELARAKAQLKSTLVFSQESMQSQMLSLGKLLVLCDELYDIGKRLKDIEKATADDINAFARRVLSQKPALAYLGRQPDVSPEF